MKIATIFLDDYDVYLQQDECFSYFGFYSGGIE